jgi:hypothetical protein
VEPDSESLGVTLLGDLRDVFAAKNTGRLESNQILDELVSMEERPWPELSRGKPMSLMQLARRLKPFGIKPEKWKKCGATKRGYVRVSCEDAFNRYLGGLKSPPPPPLGNHSGFRESYSPPYSPPVASKSPPEAPKEPVMEVELPETPQQMLAAALVRINENSAVGCVEAAKAEHPELWESIRTAEAAADKAVLSGDHESVRAAIQGMEDAWAEANSWYWARCADAEAA